MALVPGFEHDIFISYAHVDELTVDGTPGWVSLFHKHLSIELGRMIGRANKVKIWRDDALEKGQRFDDTIETALRNSAVLVSLTSNGHLASDYCQLELTMFQDQLGKDGIGPNVGDRSRFVNCLLSEIPFSDWPTVFEGTTGYDFYDREEAYVKDPSSKIFRKELMGLVQYLTRLLTSMTEKAPTTVVTEETKAATGPCIFLAETGDSLRSTRKKLAQELTREGITVVTDVPPPYEASEHDGALHKALEQTVLSVHLFGEYPDREITPGQPLTYAQHQVHQAQAAGKRPYIWVPKMLSLEEVEDEDYRDFLQSLEEGQRQGHEYEFVRGGKDQLLPQILDRWQQAQAPTPVANQLSVLLDTHVKDQLHAFGLLQELSQYNIQPYLNQQNDDPIANLDSLEERLSEVNALMVLYGSVSESWVRQRLGTFLQMSMVKGLPIQSFCVVDVPPEQPDAEVKFKFGPLPVHVLRPTNGQLGTANLSKVWPQIAGGVA